MDTDAYNNVDHRYQAFTSPGAPSVDPVVLRMAHLMAFAPSHGF